MREPRNFDKRIDTSDRHDVGNFDHSYNSGVKITEVRGKKAVRLGAR